MKTPFLTLLVSALICCGSGLYGQNTAPKMPFDPETKLITYQEVVTTSGTPLELYNRAIEWINKQYKNPADATKVRNPSSGLIEIIHRIELSRKEKGVTVGSGIVDYSMKLEMKDGRFRYTITNFNLKDVSRQPVERWMDKDDKSYSPLWDDYLKQVDAFTLNLIESLKQGMQPPAPKQPDVW